MLPRLRAAPHGIAGFLQVPKSNDVGTLIALRARVHTGGTGNGGGLGLAVSGLDAKTDSPLGRGGEGIFYAQRSEHSLKMRNWSETSFGASTPSCKRSMPVAGSKV